MRARSHAVATFLPAFLLGALSLPAPAAALTAQEAASSSAALEQELEQRTPHSLVCARSQTLCTQLFATSTVVRFGALSVSASTDASAQPIGLDTGGQPLSGATFVVGAAGDSALLYHPLTHSLTAFPPTNATGTIMVNLPSGVAEPLTNVATNYWVNQRFASASADGSVVAYEVFDPGSDPQRVFDLYVYDKATGGTAHIDHSLYDFSPRITPDGKYLTYAVFNFGNAPLDQTKNYASRIIQLNLQTRASTTLLTNDSGYYEGVALSPDGRYVAAQFEPEGGADSVVVYDRQTGSAQLYPETTNLSEPVISVSNDGRTIELHSMYGGSVYVLDRSAGTMRTISNEADRTAPNYGGVSADGSLVTYPVRDASTGLERFALYRRAEATTTFITPEPQTYIVNGPLLSPDGTTIFFDSCNNDCSAIRAYRMAVPPLQPQLSSVLFIPGTEASRLYYRTGTGEDRQVWEPTLSSDVSYLAMNADGTSKYPLFTKDIIGVGERLNPLGAEIANEFGQNVQVYGKFEKFMDSVVASSSVDMAAWRAYPYDWRYSPTSVAANGTLTELSDGSVERVYLENVLEQMASSSATGKVTIVAHSNGGLVAKALLGLLQKDGRADLVDRLVMVGAPQWGTPSDIGVMLHGDGQSWLGGLLLQAANARAVTRWLPDAYALLPSSAYFSHVANAVAVFEPGSQSGNYAAQYGMFVTSSNALEQFLENTGNVHPATTSKTDLYTPLTLPAAFVDAAAPEHALLDYWTPPPGVAVTVIAGWGQETVSGLAYTTKDSCNFLSADLFPSLCVKHLEHKPILTQDGDDTVVSPSALGDVGQQLYFDLEKFEKNTGDKIGHQDLMADIPIQQEIIALLENATGTSAYMETTKPTGGTNPLVQISTHSPVHLVITNAAVQQSGVLPMPGTDLAGIKKDIPGSAVQVFDDEEYVTVPQNSSYQVTATGYAAGAATIDVASVLSDGYASTTAALVSVPVTASSMISFSVANGAPGVAVVDENGDGIADFTVSAAAFSNDPVAYLRYVESAVRAMVLPRSFSLEISVRLRAIGKSLSVHTSARRRVELFWREMINRDAAAKQQIAGLARAVSAQVARTSSDNTDRKTESAEGRNGEGYDEKPRQLSITQAQELIAMLNYLTSLL